MFIDSKSIFHMQRMCYDALTKQFIEENKKTEETTTEQAKVVRIKKKNPYYTPAKLTTAPAMLVQELPWINTTQSFEFDFSLTAPAQVPGVNNNVNIDKQDNFAVYGVQLLFGTGTNSAAFVYRSFGVLPADDSIYQSIIQMKIESSTLVDKMNGLYFRDRPNQANQFWGECGMQVINPIRIISGELGKLKVNIQLLNPIAALVISANTVISMRLHGVYGQAQA